MGPVSVNRAWRLAMVAGGCGVFALLAASFGCAAMPRFTRSTPEVAGRYLVAMRYDVAPVAARESPNTAGALVHDFQKIAELGFADVVIRHLDEGNRQAVLSAANRAGLMAVLPSRKGKHYVTTGTLPDGCPDVESLARTVIAETAKQPALVPTGIDCGATDRTARRARSLCANLSRLGTPCVVFGKASPAEGKDALIVIDTALEATGPDRSLLESWLAQYHRGLLAGRTAGLVVDRYRRMPGDPPGLAGSSGGPRSPAQAATIRELITRARSWGPRINRLAAGPIAATPSAGLKVQVTGLERPPRRYVLVFNPSPEHYARGQVALPETAGGARLSRAVEVPASKTELAGRVFKAATGRILLPVTLRPGDAALFELF